jgi:antitoxin VapB
MAALDGFDQDFIAELEAEYRAQPLMQDREEL